MPTHPIRFGIQTGQQDCTWERMRDFWQKVDAWGYDSLWAFDHFYPIFVPDPHGPCMESWTLLGALSQHTKRARIGAMVNGNTYRNPALTAKMAATLDQICGGRLNLGLGAGWFELEHKEYGIPFPTIGGRLSRLDETLTIIKSLFTAERTSFSGKHFKLQDASFNPKPIQQPHPTILIGATGERVALGIVARHAQMWNSFGTPEIFRDKIARLEEHCQRIGRDPAEIEKSVLLNASFALDDARRQIDEYVAAGVTHIIFSLRPADRAWIRSFAERVIPSYR